MAAMTIEQALELAVGYQKSGQLAEAQEVCRQIQAQRPDDAEIQNRLGILHSLAGRNDLAAECFLRAMTLNPGSAEMACNCGAALTRLGRYDEAIARLNKALELEPQSADAMNNLALALGRKGLHEEAIANFRAALEIKPNFAEANYGLGHIYHELGDLKQAIEFYRQAVRLNPEFSRAWDELGMALRASGNVDEAITAGEKATSLRPDVALFHLHFGDALLQRGLIQQAGAIFERAIGLDPSEALYYNGLGQASYFMGWWDKAIDCFKRAIALKPDFALPHNFLGSMLRDTGRLREAVGYFEKSVALEPGSAKLHSDLVYTSHFRPEFSAADILREQRIWNERHAAPLKNSILPHENDPTPQRRLRIGYFSPDFREHVVAKNILPLLQNHDRKGFEIFCYSREQYPDAITAKCRAATDHWRHILPLSDEKIAETIRADKIDILVDLGLHMGSNGLMFFARKPAPIQLTFGGYPGGTGLETMDYRLTDRHLDPPEFDDHYVEQSIRLPDSFWCFDPKAMGVADGPDVNPLPALRNGFVTFGCLNNLAKINDGVLELWSRVLKAVPTSRLTLLSLEGESRAIISARIGRFGVDTSRVEFVSREPTLKYFEQYHRLDLGLDTLPYNGHTTSLDSFWMGVPVITLLGKTAVGRAGWSQLSNLGLTELAAKTPEEFVEIAVKLANDLPGLSELRGNLRQRMLRSPLTNAVKFARDIETAYRAIWRQCCLNSGSLQ